MKKNKLQPKTNVDSGALINRKIQANIMVDGMIVRSGKKFTDVFEEITKGMVNNLNYNTTHEIEENLAKKTN